MKEISQIYPKDIILCVDFFSINLLFQLSWARSG